MLIPDVPPALLQALRRAAGQRRLALVGGVVRDLLLHRHHQDPWRGLPDLDLVLEGQAAELVDVLLQELRQVLGSAVQLRARPHGRFGTVEVELDLPTDQGGPGCWIWPPHAVRTTPLRAAIPACVLEPWRTIWPVAISV